MAIIAISPQHAFVHRPREDQPISIYVIANSCSGNGNYNYGNEKSRFRDDRGEYDITSPVQSWTTKKTKMSRDPADHNVNS
jgi:hypothetical protein